MPTSKGKIVLSYTANKQESHKRLIARLKGLRISTPSMLWMRAYFPEGQGNSKWQENDDKLFPGIDHTAIVVDDTEESLAFYRDALGGRLGFKKGLLARDPDGHVMRIIEK